MGNAAGRSKSVSNAKFGEPYEVSRISNVRLVKDKQYHPIHPPQTERKEKHNLSCLAEVSETKEPNPRRPVGSGGAETEHAEQEGSVRHGRKTKPNRFFLNDILQQVGLPNPKLEEARRERERSEESSRLALEQQRKAEVETYYRKLAEDSNHRNQQDAELRRKEAELKQREEELRQKEAELKRREEEERKRSEEQAARRREEEALNEEANRRRELDEFCRMLDNRSNAIAEKFLRYSTLAPPPLAPGQTVGISNSKMKGHSTYRFRLH